MTVLSSVSTEIAEGTVMTVNSDGTCKPASGTPNFPLLGVAGNLCSGGDDCWITLLPNPTPTAPSGTALEVNGVANVDQALLNLVSGTGVTVTDNGGGAVSISASGGGGLLKSSVTLTPSQILNLSSAPVQLIPSPGAGLYINPIAVTLEFQPGVGTAITVVGSPQLEVDFGGGAAQQVFVLTGGQLSNFLTGGNTLTQMFTAGGNQTSYENKALDIDMSGGSLTGGSTAQIRVTTIYSVETAIS
jgi:hypothetical protein